MNAILSAYHESTKCMWCGKTAEAVTVQFDGGFLSAGELCWKCLQQATRVHHKQQTEASTQQRAPKGT
jgi:hypothetical protein